QVERQQLAPGLRPALPDHDALAADRVVDHALHAVYRRANAVRRRPAGRAIPTTRCDVRRLRRAAYGQTWGRTARTTDTTDPPSESSATMMPMIATTMAAIASVMLTRKPGTNPCRKLTTRPATSEAATISSRPLSVVKAWCAAARQIAATILISSS